MLTSAIGLYRRLTPRVVRKMVRRLRRPRSEWTSTRAELGQWSFHDYRRPRWEAEYGSGRWAYMQGLAELSRYSVVVGYARFLRPHGSILDLGCGEGILQQRLGAESYSHYLGVDISHTAIERARARADDRTTFTCADVASFAPERRFDIIVFNEVLYYLSDPVRVMRHYERFLEPNGIFILSMFADEHTRANWTTLERAYDFLDETRAGNARSGFAWSCRVTRAAG